MTRVIATEHLIDCSSFCGEALYTGKVIHVDTQVRVGYFCNSFPLQKERILQQVSGFGKDLFSQVVLKFDKKDNSHIIFLKYLIFKMCQFWIFPNNDISNINMFKNFTIFPFGCHLLNLTFEVRV